MLAAAMFWLIACVQAAVFWSVWTGRSNFWRSVYRSGPTGPAFTSFVPATAVWFFLRGLSDLVPDSSPYFAWLGWINGRAGVYVMFGFYFAASLLNLMQPPWFKAEKAERGPLYDPQYASFTLTRGDRPADAASASYHKIAQLLTEDTDRPAIGTMSYGRLGHIWLFDDRVEFRQNRMETAARGDIIDLRLRLSDIDTVSVKPPERTLANFRLLMNTNAKGLPWRWPLLQIATHDGQQHTLWVKDAEEARQAIERLRGR